MAPHAHLDHLVVAVPDLPAAMAAWSGAGLTASVGGDHPGGTHNALIRGPQPCYVELIAARAQGVSAWWQRVRGAHGPLSWAVAVPDLDEARSQLIAHGFAPARIHEGSRVTPDGRRLAWRTCDTAGTAMHPHLPFLIQWREGMPPGPADGPVVQRVLVAVPDPLRVAAALDVLGFPRMPGHAASPYAFFDGRVAVDLMPGEAGLVDLTVAGGIRAGGAGDAAADGLVLDRLSVTRVG